VYLCLSLAKVVQHFVKPRNCKPVLCNNNNNNTKQLRNDFSSYFFSNFFLIFSSFIFTKVQQRCVWDFYHLYSSGVDWRYTSPRRFTLHNLREPEEEVEVDKKIFVQRQEMWCGPPFHPSPKTSWGWFFISLEKSLTLNEQLTCRWEKRVWVSDWEEGGYRNCIWRKCQGFAGGKDVCIFVSLYLYFGNSAVRVIRQLSLQVAQEKRKRTRNKLCQPLRLAILEIHTRD